ncbi:MAG: RNA polymerase sigma factor SigJ [Actinomycetes bacterium]
MATDQAAEVFDDLRPYLHGVAYRLTSSWADAEDVVADAWARWSGHAESVDDPRAWLTRVVARLAVDHLRSARVRRESYVGPWLPEPVITVPSPGASAPIDPLDALVADESVRLAFLVVLDRLSAEQRVAIVLHDVLGLDFAGVAGVLGCSVGAARQHASRGRRRIDSAHPPRRVAADLGWQVLGELTAALREGDTGRLVRILAPEVVLTADGGGRVTAAGRPIAGATEVARFLLGLVALADRHGSAFSIEPVRVNGDPGFVLHLDSPRPRDPRTAVYGYAVRDGVVAAIYAVLAPDKLTRIPRRVAASPRASTPPRS